MLDRRVFFASCLCFLLLLSGCAGGGNGGSFSPLSTDSPELALRKTVSSWEASSGPVLSLVPLVAQTASGTTGTASETNLGTISFKDLSGNRWEFIIRSITYASTNQAEILTAYNGGASSSQIELTFVMVRSQEGWILDNFKVTKLPEVITVSPGVLRGVITEEGTGRPIVGALVALTGTSLTTMTDANGAYEFNNLTAGTYTLVVNRDGFVIKTITGIIVR